LLQERRQAIATALSGVEAEGAHHQAQGTIGPLDVAMFRRRAMQLEAELRWHDEFDRILPSLPDPARKGAAEADKVSITTDRAERPAAPAAATRPRATDRE
jgi:hypothetical protein